MFNELQKKDPKRPGGTVEKSRDQDCTKGAVEQDQQNQGGNTSLEGQLGHRDQDREIKDVDSDKAG
jgi:hypothetical protein